MRGMAANGTGAARRDQTSDLQLLVHSAPSLIHTSTPDGYLDFFNETWLTYIGTSLEDLQGWKWTAFIHPEDVEGIVEKWRASLASGEPFLHEARVLRADGAYRWMLHHKVAARDGCGQIVKWYGSSIDIEDRRRAEEQLRRSTQELQRSELYLAEGQRLAHLGSWAFDAHGFDYWSPELFRMHGLRPGGRAPTVQEYLDCVHPQDRESVANVINGHPANTSPFDATRRIVRPNGEVRYIRCVGVPVIENQSLKRYVGSALDVTEHELLTQELRRREAYLAEAQRLSRTGSFGWRPDDGEVVWSDETYRIFEYDSTVKPTVDSVLERMHPEDRVFAQQVIDRASRTGADFEQEYRLLLPDGRVKHVHAIAHAVRNASGNREFIGAVSDITGRKTAEEKIREQETELRQMLDLSSQQVAVFGGGGERLFANRIALDYVGLTLDEWRQTPGNFFRPGWYIHPDDRERVARASDSNRSHGSAFELEMRIQGADGNHRWFLVRYNPLHDDKGLVKRWYLASTDIDERKRAEEKLRQENVALREEIDKASMFEEIVGTSVALQAVISRIARVSPTDSTVLITGETGSGKELVARAIHKRSNRSSGVFVSVNCAAIPRDLIASELFGHEKGAFTGAMQRRLGRFELAEGGTIFLDEVGDLPAETQVALLRVLQEREFERVGGGRPIRCDARVVAATNRDLQKAIAEGAFRSDLFYRLNVFPLEMPSLRNRKGDIPLLIHYFIDRYAKQAGKRITRVSRKSLDLLQQYPWPGNVRELQNIVERSVILCETEEFSVDEKWLSWTRIAGDEPAGQPQLSDKLASHEKQMIEAALRESRQSVRAGRCRCQAGHTTIHSGIENSVLENQQASLQRLVRSLTVTVRKPFLNRAREQAAPRIEGTPIFATWYSPFVSNLVNW
jgi:PAS domain S-box-containing protein